MNPEDWPPVVGRADSPNAQEGARDAQPRRPKHRDALLRHYEGPIYKPGLDANDIIGSNKGLTRIRELRPFDWVVDVLDVGPGTRHYRVGHQASAVQYRQIKFLLATHAGIPEVEEVRERLNKARENDYKPKNGQPPRHWISEWTAAEAIAVLMDIDRRRT